MLSPGDDNRRQIGVAVSSRRSRNGHAAGWSTSPPARRRPKVNGGLERGERRAFVELVIFGGFFDDGDRRWISSMHRAVREGERWSPGQRSKEVLRPQLSPGSVVMSYRRTKIKVARIHYNLLANGRRIRPD